MLPIQPRVSQAQSPRVQVFCDADETFSQSPDPFPGTVFNVLRPNETRTDYQLRRTTHDSTETTTIPIPTDLIGKLTYSHVSPDGRYVTLTPLEIGVPLVIWKIGTDELATLPLSDSDVQYLLTDSLPESRQLQKITWLDKQHMVMQYFDLDYVWFDYLIAEKQFTVIDEPFQIIEGTQTEIAYPTIDGPTENTDVGKVFSPQGNYVTIASTQRNEDFTFGRRFQIYDANTLQLVTDFQSHSNRVLGGTPLWTPDESSLFLWNMLPNSPYLNKSEITQIIVEQDFKENRDLFNTLESFWGSDIKISGLSLNLAMAMSPSGNYLALHLYEAEQNQYYVIVSNLKTGEIVAKCDEGYPDTSLAYPLWSPDERYFGYWAAHIWVFDLTNGQRYSINGEGFVGWVDSATTISP
ncbi:MAG: hypothetical protein K8L97_33145 [Anaerolineae bacterium]|nr:hypothetical protein [Anaerolineae bacterium]